MERHYFGLSTLLASVALLIWSIGETFAYPQGPNVSMGSNPIVTIHCASGNSALSTYPNIDNRYVVPSGYDYIVTDVGFGSGSTKTEIYINDGNGYKTLFSLSPVGYNWDPGFASASFNTGIKVLSGHSVYCGYNGAAFISGYLVHQ